MNEIPTQPVKQTWQTIVIGIVGFIIVPILVTAIIETSWIKLSRNPDGVVSAKAYTCVLFVIPWKIQSLTEVVSVQANLVRGDSTEERKDRSTGKRSEVHIDGEGQLVLAGAGAKIAVSVSPASLNEAASKIETFLQTNGANSMTLFAIANWKFGLGMGVPLALFAWLYIVGSLLAMIRASYRLLRGTSKV